VKVPPTDTELLRRYAVLYPKPTQYQTARLEVIKAQLKTNGPEAEAWRKQQLALMGDVSHFMKLLKQRFSVWYNKSHQRYGTLWAERFKSVLVEPQGRVIETMAAYIDLNCVRAGLAVDPKDYRFCGYGEAVGGNIKARAGLQTVRGTSDWASAQCGYREVLFGAVGFELGFDDLESGRLVLGGLGVEHRIAAEQFCVRWDFLPVRHPYQDVKVIGQHRIGEDFDPAIVGHLPELLAQDFLADVIDQVLPVHRSGYAVINRLPVRRRHLDPCMSHPRNLLDAKHSRQRSRAT